MCRASASGRNPGTEAAEEVGPAGLVATVAFVVTATCRSGAKSVITFSSQAGASM